MAGDAGLRRQETNLVGALDTIMALLSLRLASRDEMRERSSPPGGGGFCAERCQSHARRSWPHPPRLAVASIPQRKSQPSLPRSGHAGAGAARGNGGNFNQSGKEGNSTPLGFHSTHQTPRHGNDRCDRLCPTAPRSPPRHVGRPPPHASSMPPAFFKLRLLLCLSAQWPPSISTEARRYQQRFHGSRSQ